MSVSINAETTVDLHVPEGVSLFVVGLVGRHEDCGCQRHQLHVKATAPTEPQARSLLDVTLGRISASVTNAGEVNHAA